MQKENGIRLFLLLSVLITLLLVMFGTSTQVVLAIMQPFRPGDIIFPVQDFAEQARAHFTPGKTERAAYYLELAQQRTEDLLILAKGEHALLAVNYLNRALDQAIEAVIDSPEQDFSYLSDQLSDLVLQIDIMLTNISEVLPGDNEAIEKLEAKVATLSRMLAGLPPADQVALDQNPSQALSRSAARLGSLIERGALMEQPYNVEFPPGSPGAMHLFYPLEGEHGQLDCSDCHVNGKYAGTLNLCADCHSDVIPASHFSGDCSDCHTPVSWQEINFDHSLADTTDCQLCHNSDKPDNHYAGQCSACHNTVDWAQASFNHQAIDTKDCLRCHSNDKPADHFGGQCSACHNTTSWQQASFNHQAVGATDCKSCHSGQKPANHYSGQCSACHKTSSWKDATFNHSAVGATDCKSCHSGDKPGNHFSGQCSACHKTSSWKDATFDHSAVGATDCKSCHSGDKPGNHFSGQCSACHKTSSWKDATFNHSAVGATDCKSCHSGDKPGNHFSGQCSACHKTSTWKDVTFDHSAVGATDCKSCHSGNKPANHFDGQCSQCHSTSSWSDASFNHSFPMKHGGANGNCSKCHPAGGSKYDCYACHNQDKMTKKHNEEGISDIGSRCLDCHPNGKEGDEGDDD
jgi:hypothetical protein